MKKAKKLLSVLLALAMLFALTACNVEDENEETVEEETVEVTESPVITPEPTEEPEPEPEAEPLSESDLLPFIAFYDLYVAVRDETVIYPTADEEAAEGLEEADGEASDEIEKEVYDPLGCLGTPVIYDDTVVISIAFDGTAVDVTVPGDYDLIFTVTIDREAYDAALLAPGASAEASSEPVTQEVIITKTVHIVTTEDYAAALADGTISEITEGTAIVVVEDEVDEVIIEEDSDEEDGEDADEPDVSDDDSKDNDTTDSTDDKSDSDNTSTNNDSDTSDVTSPTTTTAPATSTGSGSSTSSGSTSSGSTSSGSTSSGTSSSTATATPAPTASATGGSGSTSSGSTSSSTATATPAPTASPTSGSTSSGTSSSTATATPAPTATAHVHTWVTVEDGYYETVETTVEVVDQEAYTEYISYDVCNTCGEKFLIANGTSGIDYHCSTEGHSSYYTTVVKIPHDTVTHEETTTEQVWVDTSYQVCSECGATQ